MITCIRACVGVTSVSILFGYIWFSSCIASFPGSLIMYVILNLQLIKVGRILNGSCYYIRLCGTLWTAACQAPLSTGFSRQVYLEWVGMPSFRESSQRSDQTQVSCTAGRFFIAEPVGGTVAKALGCEGAWFPGEGIKRASCGHSGAWESSEEGSSVAKVRA